MKLALQIAWRFLSSAKRQTLVIILGIAVVFQFKSLLDP